MTSLSNLGGARCGVPGSFSQDPAAWVVMGYHNDEAQCNRQYIHALTWVWVAVLGMREPPPPTDARLSSESPNFGRTRKNLESE